MMSQQIQVHGHRGARAVYPENTIPAFEYAIGCGVDAIELDVAVTRDDVLVVAHDPVLSPPICSGPRPDTAIRELSLAELSEWDCGATKNPEFPKQKTVPGTHIPTLAQVFDLASRGSFLFNVELKSFPDRPQYTPPPEEFASMVLGLIRERALERRVIVQSFDFRPLRAIGKLAPEIRLSALTAHDQREFPAIAADAGTHMVSPHYGLVTRAKVETARNAGIGVMVWTANSLDVWYNLINAGVDAIITDDPAELIASLRRWRSAKPTLL
jgi:glycerophosphoryl diester phosphodiesterase